MKYRDYYDLVQEPIDLTLIQKRIDQHFYNTLAPYLDDINLLVRNNINYFDKIKQRDDSPYFYRASELADDIIGYIEKISPDLLKECERIKTRGLIPRGKKVERENGRTWRPRNGNTESPKKPSTVISRVRKRMSNGDSRGDKAKRRKIESNSNSDEEDGEVNGDGESNDIIMLEPEPEPEVEHPKEQLAIKVPSYLLLMKACEKCGSMENEESMLLCDECDKGYHMYCMSPALDSIPKGDWFCPKCRPPPELNVVEEEMEEISEEEVIVPKLQVNAKALEKFQTHLIRKTEGVNVDTLQKLRVRAMQEIMRARFECQKLALLKKLIKIVTEVTDVV
mmetsp:Transcript_11250/g.12372  ORF Transcript_11250/g.12372 Transcript_11250/m.12372 type:complete len:337 (+) Transcript_11250:1-1011(+)